MRECEIRGQAAQLGAVIDRLAKYGSVTTSIMLSSMRPAPITYQALAPK